MALITAMLFSSTGVRISQHWCGGELINATIWGEAESCSHAVEMIDCPIHGKMAVEKNCCEEREVIVEGGDEDYIVSAHVVQPVTDYISLLNTTSNTELIEFVPRILRFLNHSPPLIGTARYVVIQSFLI